MKTKTRTRYALAATACMVVAGCVERRAGHYEAAGTLHPADGGPALGRMEVECVVTADVESPTVRVTTEATLEDGGTASFACAMTTSVAVDDLYNPTAQAEIWICVRPLDVPMVHPETGSQALGIPRMRRTVGTQEAALHLGPLDIVVDGHTPCETRFFGRDAGR